MPLTTGIDPLDKELGGFRRGKLILVGGDLWKLDFPHLLSVRSQLPKEEGGLDSIVLWLDGGNSFNPYKIGKISKNMGLNSKEVLERIYISRAFTCYQMSSLILEKLPAAIDVLESSFLVISDLPYLYFHSDIPRKEAIEALKPVISEIRSFLDSEKALILATSVAHFFPGQINEIYESLAPEADVNIQINDRLRGVEIRFVDHFSQKSGKIVLGSEERQTVPLDEFADDTDG